MEVQHPEIGAMLAQRWKFPDQLVMPVRYHERPTAAPQGHHELVRLVGLGNLAHDALTNEDPTPALRKLYERADQWFGIKTDATQALMKKIAEGAKDMSRNLKLDTGASADAESIVRKAEKAMIELASKPGGAGQTLENLLVDADQYDPLTGAVGRTGFDKALRNGFELSGRNKEPLTLVQVGIDGLRNTTMKIGSTAGDETVNSCVMLLRKHFATLGGVVCTLGGDIYALVLYGANAKDAQKAAEEFRFSFEKAVITWPLGGGTLKVSMGIASNEPAAGSTFSSVQELVISAVTALKTARAGDGRGIALGAPKKAAA